MTPMTIAIIGLVGLIVLLVIGVPVGTTMCMVGFFGMGTILNFPAAMSKVGSVAFETINSYNFAVMPLFMLMANLISSTGIGDALYDFFNKTIGRFRGGLAMATVGACAVFAAISSSTMATAVTIGLIALPQMKQLGYDDRLSTGSIAAGGTLGVLIPPSGILITYGIISQTSISKLLMAGLVPGLILAALFCVSIIITTKRRPESGPRGEKYSGKEVWKSFLSCGEIIVLILLVIGGMFAGWFTPTEASAVGAGGALLITLVRKKLTWKTFQKALIGTLNNTGSVYIIIIAALIMNYLLTVSGVPMALSSLISRMNVSYKVVTLVILVIYLFLGCFMDALAMILLTMPIFLPVMTALGADLVWFGIVVTIAMQMASVTPPVGMNVYVTAALDKSIPMENVFKGIVPFLICMIILGALMILFPGIVTWLPNMLG